MRAKPVVTLLVVCGLLFGAPAPAFGSDEVDDFRFSSFEADYYLERADDGSSRLRTVETLVAEFPDFDQNRGIVRAIPTGYEGADVDLQIASVTGEDGTPVPYEESHEDGRLLLALGTDEFVHGTQTYVISYDQRHVTRGYDDTDSDEFYWDTNGTGWSQPFDTLTARVHVEESLTRHLTGNTACYRGIEGADDACALDQATEEDGVVFTATADDLEPGENVTVAVGFERGTFDEPARARDAAWVTIVPAVLAGLAVLLLIAAAALRLTRLRDAPGRGIIVPQYTPPRGVNLMLAGNLIGRDSSSLAGQLISFAVRRIVRIIDITNPATGLPDDGHESFAIEFIGRGTADDHENRVLKVLFGADLVAGAQREIGAGQADIAQSLHAQLAVAPKEAMRRGLRRSAAKGTTTLLWSSCAALGVAISIVFVLLAVRDALVTVPVILLMGAIVIVVLAVIVTARGPLITAEGAEIRDYLIGIREYLELAEADRFRMLQSPSGALRRDDEDDRRIVLLNEKLLPFAVLWGIEDRWADELDRLYSRTGDSPEWYIGTQPFNTAGFTGVMTSFNGQATAAAAWAGGGSTGGGFSGGGGGGGGGGGR